MAYAAETNKLALFLPEPYDVIWSLVILVVLAAFFYKFVMPKFQAILDERAENCLLYTSDAADDSTEV